MIDSVNAEGLTFIEWVLAAGVASFVHIASEGVFPYTTSSSKWTPRPYKQTHYPRKIRLAWRNGEDPTEYRK